MHNTGFILDNVTTDYPVYNDDDEWWMILLLLLLFMICMRVAYQRMLSHDWKIEKTWQ